MNYTLEIERLAKELGVSESVAMDIDYLRSFEKRIIEAAKAHPEVISFHVDNDLLEKQLFVLLQ
jgi:hypothetical protein